MQPADLVSTVESASVRPREARDDSRAREPHGLGGVAQQFLALRVGFAISSSSAAGASALLRTLGKPAAI
jgi:hypothetical protein